MRKDLHSILAELRAHDAQLVAVSKTHSNASILELYEQGQRDFGENRAQELVDKAESLPKDIRWHFIGHLQRNKAKYAAPFIHLFHAGDSPRILKEMNKQAARHDRVINCLLQFKIAEEDTKYGMDWPTAVDFLNSDDFAAMQHIRLTGVMGMATYTPDQDQVRREFKTLRDFYDRLKAEWFADKPHFKEISMGMSGDYTLALDVGSTMVRIGSLLFGDRHT